MPKEQPIHRQFSAALRRLLSQKESRPHSPYAAYLLVDTDTLCCMHKWDEIRAKAGVTMPLPRDLHTRRSTGAGRNWRGPGPSATSGDVRLSAAYPVNSSKDIAAAHHDERSGIQKKLVSVSPDVSQGILNMRSGPGIGHPIIVSIPAGTHGLELGTCRSPDDGKSRYKWCDVEWKGFSGWVSSGSVRPIP